MYFKVSVDDVFRVEVADCGDDFCCVEASAFLWEEFHAGEVVEEFASIHVLHHETQTVVGLEGILQLLFKNKNFVIRNAIALINVGF